MGGQRLKNANAWEAAHQPMDKEFNTSTAKIGCRERESAMPSSDQCPAIGRSLTAEIRRLRRGVMRRSLKLLQRAFPWFQTQQSLPPMPALLRRRVERAGRPRIPSPRCFRVVYVVISGISDAACMRYRAYNIMEALRKVGVESECRDYRVLSNRPSELLAFDLIVLVRRRSSPEVDLLLQFARNHSIPVVCDLDDYLFDEAVLPHSEYLRMLPPEDALAVIRAFAPRSCSAVTTRGRRRIWLNGQCRWASSATLFATA